MSQICHRIRPTNSRPDDRVHNRRRHRRRRDRRRPNDDSSTMWRVMHRHAQQSMMVPVLVPVRLPLSAVLIVSVVMTVVHYVHLLSASLDIAVVVVATTFAYIAIETVERANSADTYWSFLQSSMRSDVCLEQFEILFSISRREAAWLSNDAKKCASRCVLIANNKCEKSDDTHPHPYHSSDWHIV